MTDTKQETTPRGILTHEDREFLAGQKELSQGSKRNTRLRIRKRVRQSLTDFKLLWYCLPDKDLELIFNPDDKNERQNIRSSTHYAFAFLLLGLWANRDPHSGRLEDAFQQAAFESGWLTDVSLEISAERAPNAELIPAKIRHKEQKIQDISERLKQDQLSESNREELEAELQKEHSFRYLLFEEALVSPSVDEDAVASLMPDGEESGITPEEINKSKKAEAESPLLRKSLPIVTDVRDWTDQEDFEQTEEQDMEDQ